MEEILEEFAEENDLTISAEDLVELASRLLLENNYFEFDHRIYRQKLGTAIATKFALSFAKL